MVVVGVLLNVPTEVSAAAADAGVAALPTSGDTYRLISVSSGQCLDVPRGSVESGTLLQQWPCNGTDPQNWRLTGKGGGYFTLVNERSVKCLDVPGSTTLNGADLQQWTCNDTHAQLWLATSTGTDTYTFVSKTSGRCLDLTNSSTAQGAAIQQWTCNQTTAQRWRLERARTIMPLGDSITDGQNGTGGYRSDLWQMLQADGGYLDLVGSQWAGPAMLADRSHEGHSGWRIDQIDAQLAGWLSTYRPDIVLAHLGTNDVSQRYDLAQAPSRLAALIDRITAALPDTTVYVATIVPRGDADDEELTATYNAAIPAIVQTRADAGMQVRLVDMHAALDTTDLADGIHPTNGGYSKMASHWHRTISGAPTTRWEAESATNTLTNARVIPTRYASGDMKVGYLDEADSSLDVAVTVPAGGTYRMYVRADNPMGTVCSHTVTVNATAAGRELQYQPYGLTQWTVTATEVPLDAGANTIRFAHSTCSAEIDAIDLAGLPAAGA
jgi:lysophospholipase L1-like esterase